MHVITVHCNLEPFACLDVIWVRSKCPTVTIPQVILAHRVSTIGGTLIKFKGASGTFGRAFSIFASIADGLCALCITQFCTYTIVLVSFRFVDFNIELSLSVPMITSKSFVTTGQ